MNIKNIGKKRHVWTTYLNPRNNAVQLKACANCGIIKGLASNHSNCKSVSKRVSETFATQGWVEYSQQIA